MQHKNKLGNKPFLARLKEASSILLNKPFGEPAHVPADLVKQRDSLSSEDKSLISRIGTSMSDLRKVITQQTQINYGRLSMYREVDQAILYPLIGSAVEMYTEVASTYSQLHSSTVWVTSEDRHISNVLNKFLDTICVEERIYDWLWNVGAYGDLFVEVEGAPGVGIVSIMDDEHPINLSRADYKGRLIGFYETPLGNSAVAKDLQPPWKYVHFRLLGARKKRPIYTDPNYTDYRSISLGMMADTRLFSTKYGVSLVNNALPIYKRLRLSEDSLMLSRLSKGVLRYVYKVGVDSCFTGDTQINLADGTSPAIKHIVDNIDYYKGRSVLTVNPKTLEVEPGKIVGGKLTIKNAQLVRVSIDNGRYVDCTPDHRFMLRDGTYKQAQYLESGDSLMPYRTSASGAGYPTVYAPNDHKHKFVHRLMVGNACRGMVVHHKDFNVLNNDLSNLQVMSVKEHMLLHKKEGTWQRRIGDGVIEAHKRGAYDHFTGSKRDKEFCASVSRGVKKAIVEGRKRCDGRKGKKYTPRIEVECVCGCGRKFEVRVTQKTKFYNRDCFVRWAKGNLKPTPQAMEAAVKSHVGSKPWNYGLTKDSDIRVAKYGETFKEHYREGVAGYRNHKVVSVEFLSRTEDVYDIQIDKNNNFPLNIGVFVHNSNLEAVAEIVDEYKATLKRARAINTTPGEYNFDERMNDMGVNEDIIVPVWGDVNNLAIEELGGKTDIRWITDIEEQRNQLASALRIPLQLLGGYSSELPASLGQSSLERLDIRFARSARRLQRAGITGITRLCQLHLAYLNMNPSTELFQVNMAETSSAEEEELKDALDKGVDIVDKLSDLIVKHAGEDIDKLELIDYLNQKVLKLNDLDLRTMVTRVQESTGKRIYPYEPGQKPLTEQDDEQAKVYRDTHGIRDKSRVYVSDYKAALPRLCYEIVEGDTTRLVEAKGSPAPEGSRGVMTNPVWDEKYKGKKVKISEVKNG